MRIKRGIRQLGSRYLQIICLFLVSAFVATPLLAQPEPLPSWKYKFGGKRLDIINFVNDVTNRHSSQYVPAENRIATIGFKGTLVGDQRISAEDNTTYSGLTYQPMKELLAYLHDNGFTCWIVSSSGEGLLKQYAESTYGVSSERVIGNVGHERKVSAIKKAVDVRPIFAAGNTVNDYAMLRYSRQQPRETMQLLIYHDDANREIDYGASNAVKIEQANARNWHLVSMKGSWKSLFNQAEIRERESLTGKQTVTIPRLSASQRPQIDGNLNDEIYQNKKAWSRPFVGMLSRGFGAIEAQTTVFAAYDDENFYVAFDNAEPDIKNMKIEGDERDSKVYNGESIEISVLKPGEPTDKSNAHFYHFIVNPNGVVYDDIANDGDSSPADFNPIIEGSTTIHNNGWTAEFAIPWAELGITDTRPGTEIRANFARARKGSQEEYSSWSQFNGGFLEADNLGILILGK